MTSIKKTAAVALTALTLAVAAAPSAEARYHRGGAVAAGVLGGIVAGALIAGSSRPAYAAPVYGGPAYGGGCYRKHVGYTYHGNPIFRTVCY